MFVLTVEPIDPRAHASLLTDHRAGGFVTFEGWVREHNAGKAVTALEYEAYEPLATKEGNRILAEARQRFPIRQVRCVHRLGRLELGEVAVWVGVCGVHRDEAFQACRYTIDELKVRVPIWKKEYYADGDSGWVACERCARHRHQGEDVTAPPAASR